MHQQNLIRHFFIMPICILHVLNLKFKLLRFYPGRMKETITKPTSLKKKIFLIILMLP